MYSFLQNILVASAICFVPAAQTIQPLQGADGQFQKDLYAEPASYLDAKQARIAAQTKLNWSNLILLANAKDKSGGLSVVREKRKDWTVEERATLEPLLERLWHVAPGLLINAANGRKLLLCRSEKSVRGSFTTASALPGAIVIFDPFFKLMSEKHQFHLVIHELVHEADSSSRIADSPEWRKFCGADLARLRIKLALAPSDDVKKCLAEERSLGSALPTSYSTKNFVEALAEVGGQAVIYPTSEVGKAFLDEFGSQLTVPHAPEMAVDTNFRAASIEYRSHQINKSISTISKVVATESTLARAHEQLARCEVSKRKYWQALPEANKADFLLRKTGAFVDEDFISIRKIQMICCSRLKKTDQLHALVSQTLEQFPFQPDALQFRAGVRYADWYENAFALYWLKYGQDYYKLFKDAFSDPDLVLTTLTNDTQTLPLSSAAFLRRGHFLECLGDREQEKQKRQNYYDRAMGDYQFAFSFGHSPEALLDNCHMSLKQKSINDARSCEQTGEKLFPLSDETRVMQIELQHASGNKDEAGYNYQILFRQIMTDVLKNKRRTS